MRLHLRAIGRGLRLGLTHMVPRPVPWGAILVVGILQALVAVGGVRAINWMLVGRPLLPASLSLLEIALLLGVSVGITMMRTFVHGREHEYPRHAATAAAWFVLTVLLAGWSQRVAQLGMLRAIAITTWLVLVFAGGAALLALLRHPDGHGRALFRSRMGRQAVK